MRPMALLFFLFISACAATTVSHRAQALSGLGVAATGTAYDGPSIVSIQCEPAQGDAALVARLLLGKARGETIKLRCGGNRAQFAERETTTVSSAPGIQCLKFVIRADGVLCSP